MALTDEEPKQQSIRLTFDVQCCNLPAEKQQVKKLDTFKDRKISIDSTKKLVQKLASHCETEPKVYTIR
jgi:hypothetical protein